MEMACNRYFSVLDKDSEIRKRQRTNQFQKEERKNASSFDQARTMKKKLPIIISTILRNHKMKLFVCVRSVCG